MEEISYLFIDGGHLRGTLENDFEQIIGAGWEFDCERIIADLFPDQNMRNFYVPPQIRKAFYYDCLDETEAEKIASIPQMHVRQGHLKPGKKREQKEVDVQLAVEMLTNAFHKNMTTAPRFRSLAREKLYICIAIIQQIAQRLAPQNIVVQAFVY